MKKKIAVIVPPAPGSLRTWKYEASAIYCWAAHELDAQGRIIAIGWWWKTRREAKEYGARQFRRYCIARVETLK